MKDSLSLEIVEKIGFESYDWLNKIGNLDIFVQVIILFVVYLLIEVKISSLTSVNKEVFQSNSILIKALKTHKPARVLSLLFVPLIMMIPYTSWDLISDVHLLRYFISLIAIILGVTYSTYYYNFYFNKFHYIDRLSLLISSVLVYFHPIFCFPTLITTFLILGQFFTPFYNSWTDKKLILETFTLVLPFVLLNGFGFYISFEAFIIVGISILAHYYYSTAKGKLAMRWDKENRLSNLLVATRHQNSWNLWISERKFQGLLNFIDKMNPLFIYGTIILEVLVIVMLSNQVLYVFILSGLVVFHIVIFFLTGIFFWKNIVILLSYILIIFILPESTGNNILGFLPVIFSILLVYLLLRGDKKTPQLYWWDSPYSVKYYYEGVTENGDVFSLPPSLMAPYDINFAQGRFYNYFTTKKVVGCFGLVNDKETLDFLNTLEGDDLKLFIEKRAHVELKNDTNEYYLFLKMFGNYLNSKRKLRFLKFIQPPQHIWSVGESEKYDFKHKLVVLNVYVSEQLRTKELFRKKVAEIILE